MKLIMAGLMLLGAAQLLAEENREQQLADFFVSLANSTQFEGSAAYERHFMPEAVMFLPNRPPLKGRKAIGQWFTASRREFLMVLDQYKQEQMDIVGDVALVHSSSTGHYIVTQTGEEIPFEHKFLDFAQSVMSRLILHKREPGQKKLADYLIADGALVGEAVPTDSIFRLVFAQVTLARGEMYA